MYIIRPRVMWVIQETLSKNREKGRRGKEIRIWSKRKREKKEEEEEERQREKNGTLKGLEAGKIEL